MATKLEGRIKKIEQLLAIKNKWDRHITATQSEPNSNIYNIEEHLQQGKKAKNFKKYTVDNIDKFYEDNTGDNIHILKIDIVDNSEVERYFFKLMEEDLQYGTS